MKICVFLMLAKARGKVWSRRGKRKEKILVPYKSEMLCVRAMVWVRHMCQRVYIAFEYWAMCNS